MTTTTIGNGSSNNTTDTTTANATSYDAKVYERGTPRGPLSSKARIVILSLILFGSSCITSLILDDYEVDTILFSLLGAASCIVGSLYNTITFTILWNTLILFSSLVAEISMKLKENNTTTITKLSGRIDFWVSIIKPCLPLGVVILFIAMTMTTKGSSSVISSFRRRLEASLSLLRLYWLSSILVLPPTLGFCLGFMVLFIKNCDTMTESTTLFCSGIVGVSLVVVSRAWYNNRSHKYLSLLTPAEVCNSVVTMITFSYISIISITEEAFLLPSLLGCAIATLTCVTFAATADVWYTISTGQFWMCTLDIATGGLYILLPLTLLGYRFRELFGSHVCNAIQQQQQPVLTFLQDYILTDNEQQLGKITMTSLVQMLALSSMMGITMIRMLCPFGAHLYGRVYTHGQPNTKSIAICIIADNNWEQNERLLSAISSSSLDNTKVLLNFIVTTEQMRQNVTLIQSAKAAGHTIIPYTNEAAQHQQDSNNLFFNEQQKLEWSHGISHPSDMLALCSPNNDDTKIVLWSHYYDKNVKPNVKETVLAESRGGSIVCLKEQPIPVIVEFITKLIQEEGYTVSSLSKVVKDDPPMLLSTNLPSSNNNTTTNNSNNVSTTTNIVQNISE